MLRFIYRVFLAVALVAAVAVVAFRIAAAHRESATVADLLLPESRLVETRHGQLHVLEAGPEGGAPVLLIHGSIGWAGLWQPEIERLAAEGYRAVAVDLPPMGLSERQPGLDYSRQAQALRLLALVETLEIRPVLVAHSLGAGAAMEAVFTEPDAFRGAVLVSPALMLGQDGTGRELALPLRPKIVREVAMALTITNPLAAPWLLRAHVARPEAVTDAIVARVARPFTRQGTTEALAEALPAILLPPRGAASTDPARHAALGLPVALIWGRQDTVTPPAEAETLRAALGDEATIRWLPETGHLPQIEAPEPFHRELTAALAEIVRD